jgi:hypothetical protein
MVPTHDMLKIQQRQLVLSINGFPLILRPGCPCHRGSHCHVANVKFRTANDVSLPPGPPAELLIGHARLIPPEHQAEFYHEMRKRYGK